MLKYSSDLSFEKPARRMPCGGYVRPRGEVCCRPVPPALLRAGWKPKPNPSPWSLHRFGCGAGCSARALWPGLVLERCPQRCHCQHLKLQVPTQPK